MKTRMGYLEYCKEVVRELENYEGQVVYGCDLAYLLCKEMFLDGTCTYSTYETIEYLKEWWDDCGDFLEEWKFQTGETLNPFTEPEKFMINMIYEGISIILSEIEFIDNNWNDEFELIDENIKLIIKQVEDITEIDW